MKKIKWILAIVAIGLITGSPCYAQWVRTYGGSGVDIAKSIQQTSDGGYVVCGYTDSFGTMGHTWVLKLNSNGTVAWENTYGGPAGQGAVCIDETFYQGSADGYIVAGGPGPPDADFGVLKLNLDGTKAWQKTYGGDYDDSAYWIQQTADGGYVVSGYTDSFLDVGGTGHDWILKLTSNGTVTWEYSYGGPLGMGARSIQQTFNPLGSPNGYIVANGPSAPVFGKLGILRLNSDGTTVWQKHYDGVAGAGHAKSVQQTSDGGYVVVGTTNFNTETSAFWVLKLNSNGTVAWERGNFSGHVPYSIQQTSDGGYVVAGSTFGAGNKFLWVLKLDSDGNYIWDKLYGGSDVDVAYSIQQTSDGGYVVAGSTKSFGAGNEDFWVLKLDANGEIPGCLEPIVLPPIIIYEDPVVVTDIDDDRFRTSAYIYDVLWTPEETQAASDACETPVIDKIRGVKEPRKKIRIIGSNFGDTQGDSVVHLGSRTYDSSKRRIKLWSDTMIKIKLPNYPCSWFKGKDVRRVKVWVTVNGVDGNVKKIRVHKPDTCL
jgi:uncharacterized delta-60 repeat protein